MMFGTMFAVVYAVPRHEAWTVCANTTWRPNPMTRASIVIAPISTAARPIPPPRCRALPARLRARSLFRRRRQVSIFGRTGVGSRPGKTRVLLLSRDRHGGHLRRGPTAEHVQPAQRRGALDHLGEADLLARRGYADDRAEQDDAARPGQACRRRAEHRAEGVRAGVTQHRALAQVLGQQG